MRVEVWRMGTRMALHANDQKIKTALQAQLGAQGQGAGLRMLRQMLARMESGEIGIRVEIWCRATKAALTAVEAASQQACTNTLERSLVERSADLAILQERLEASEADRSECASQNVLVQMNLDMMWRMVLQRTEENADLRERLEGMGDMSVMDLESLRGGAADVARSPGQSTVRPDAEVALTDRRLEGTTATASLGDSIAGAVMAWRQELGASLDAVSGGLPHGAPAHEERGADEPPSITSDMHEEQMEEELTAAIGQVQDGLGLGLGGG